MTTAARSVQTRRGKERPHGRTTSPKAPTYFAGPGLKAVVSSGYVTMMPQYWLDFVEANQIARKSFRLTEDDDQSGVGAELTVLTPGESEDEAGKSWPGVGLAADGYVPVASCDVGSGDWFYINANDGISGPLYRIYRDSVSGDGYEPSDAVDVVLRNYERLLAYSAKS